MNQLKTMLAIRRQYEIYASRQIAIPSVQSKGLLVMVHALPHNQGLQVTALNFGAHALVEEIPLAETPSPRVVDMFTGRAELLAAGALRVALDGYAGKSYWIPPA
ncbi:MAG: hypothetical protein KDE54_36525 [Caldilineaceae bacterium]|nr:hypothetical protein [Caldilineaceae bacterium]